MSEAQRKILAEMTRAAAADGHYDTADEFVQTREPFPCDECAGIHDVQFIGGANWCKPCRDFFDSLPPMTSAEARAILAYHESAERDIHGNRL